MSRFEIFVNGLKDRPFVLATASRPWAMVLTALAFCIVLTAAPVAASAGEMVEAASTANFSQIAGKGVVLVDFWAPWCGPCRKQAPVLHAVARRAPPHARVVKVNIDEHPTLATRFDVRSIPTMLLLVDGRPVERFVGFRDAMTLTAALNRTVARRLSETAYEAPHKRPSYPAIPVAYEQEARSPYERPPRAVSDEAAAPRGHGSSVRAGGNLARSAQVSRDAPVKLPRAGRHAPKNEQKWTPLTPLMQLGETLRFW